MLAVACAASPPPEGGSAAPSSVRADTTTTSDAPEVAAAEDPKPQRSAVPKRIVAIGDLHGDLAQARAALVLAELIDDRDRWTGGTTVLVQTGDLFDRGPDSKALVDFFRALAPQARAAGGQVINLLGNHEVMNLVGDLRYVHPGDTRSFGGPEARADALRLDGDYGAWIAEQPIAARVGDTIFVHGGITERWAKLGIDGLNARVHDTLREPEPSRAQAEVLGAEGPLWYRGYVTDTEDMACPRLERALAHLRAERMVVGHTTQRTGTVLSRCDGRLHVIDIGIGTAYGGNLGAWSWSEGNAVALRPSGVRDLPDPPSPGPRSP